MSKFVESFLRMKFNIVVARCIDEQYFVRLRIDGHQNIHVTSRNSSNGTVSIYSTYVDQKWFLCHIDVAFLNRFVRRDCVFAQQLELFEQVFIIFFDDVTHRRIYIQSFDLLVYSIFEHL